MKNLITLLIFSAALLVSQEAFAQKTNKKGGNKAKVDTTSGNKVDDIAIDEAGAPKKKGGRSASKDSSATINKDVKLNDTPVQVDQPKDQEAPQSKEEAKAPESQDTQKQTEAPSGAGSLEAAPAPNFTIDEAGAPKVKKVINTPTVPAADSLKASPLQIFRPR